MISGGGAPTQVSEAPGEERPEDTFVSKVLRTTETTWAEKFSAGAMTYYSAAATAYKEPTLVLFAGGVATEGCGSASSAVGPFYCPADEKVYLDTDFFDQLSQQLGAPGDFAQAYVIAHEIGHHVQKLIGVSDKAEQARAAMSGAQYNQFQVKMELQADCFAGVWGNAAQKQNLLDPDDLSEALNAASQIGDDTLQKRSSGRVMPDSFTHGTSEQRERWFRKGFESGDPKQCDTFRAPSL